MENEIKESKAKKRKTILKKFKGIVKEHEKTADFKEPIAILLRRTGRAEWYEDVTQGMFKFKHTCGEERYIVITPENKFTFDYGKKEFRGYLLHEDFPSPLPETPLLTTEVFALAIDKTKETVKEWKAKELRAKSKLMEQIAVILMIIIGGIILAQLIMPGGIRGLILGTPAEQAAKAAAEAAKTTITRLP